MCLLILGGEQIKKIILQGASSKGSLKYNISGFPEGRYYYCDLLKYAAFILLPYSVFSYFALELNRLAVPIFIPSPRLYAR